LALFWVPVFLLEADHLPHADEDTENIPSGLEII
jgi:hypothetical protein